MTKMDKNCSDCPSQDNCSQMYERMGSSDTPPVAMNVVLVFLLPIILFIGVLIICDKFLPIESDAIKTAVSALIAFGVTYLYLLIAKKIVRKRADKFKKKF